MDQNLLFVILLVLLAIFIIRKNVTVTLTIVAITLVYYWYSSRFTSPREFINYIQGKTVELFSPCSISNPAYCNDENSDWTFLPDIMRAKLPSSDPADPAFINYSLSSFSKNSRIGPYKVPLSKMLTNVPILEEFKIYLEKVVKFIVDIRNTDPIAIEFLINKLQNKMGNVFFCANEAATNMTLPEQTYNDLLFAQRDFSDNLNIVMFSSLDEKVNYDLVQLQKELAILNLRLNKFIISKVNYIKPEDYNILSGRLPDIGEPLAANQLDFDIKV